MSLRASHVVRVARRRRQAGFNMLEVMIALLILTITVASVASLTTVTTRANEAARNRTQALLFLGSWLERVKMDAMAWDGTTATPALFDGEIQGTWFRPAPVASVGVQRAADFWAADVAVDGADSTVLSAVRNPRYYVELRWQPLVAGTVRADIFVWWHREGAGNAVATDRGRYFDGDYGGDDITVDPRIYRVMASTTLVATP